MSSNEFLKNIVIPFIIAIILVVIWSKIVKSMKEPRTDREIILEKEIDNLKLQVYECGCEPTYTPEYQDMIMRGL